MLLCLTTYLMVPNIWLLFKLENRSIFRFSVNFADTSPLLIESRSEANLLLK